MCGIPRSELKAVNPTHFYSMGCDCITTLVSQTTELILGSFFFHTFSNFFTLLPRHPSPHSSPRNPQGNRKSGPGRFRSHHSQVRQQGKCPGRFTICCRGVELCLFAFMFLSGPLSNKWGSHSIKFECLLFYPPTPGVGIGKLGIIELKEFKQELRRILGNLWR